MWWKFLYFSLFSIFHVLFAKVMAFRISFVYMAKTCVYSMYTQMYVTVGSYKIWLTDNYSFDKAYWYTSLTHPLIDYPSLCGFRWELWDCNRTPTPRLSQDTIRSVKVRTTPSDSLSRQEVTPEVWCHSDGVFVMWLLSAGWEMALAVRLPIDVLLDCIVIY